MGGLIGFLILALDVFAIMNVAKGSLSDRNKILWTVLILLFPLVAIAFYYLLIRKKSF